MAIMQHNGSDNGLSPSFCMRHIQDVLETKNTRSALCQWSNPHIIYCICPITTRPIAQRRCFIFPGQQKPFPWSTNWSWERWFSLNLLHPGDGFITVYASENMIIIGSRKITKVEQNITKTNKNDDNHETSNDENHRPKLRKSQTPSWCTMVVELILLVLKSNYPRIMKSIPFLLMPWLLASPGHQQPWYYTRWEKAPLSSTGKYITTCATKVLRNERKWKHIFLCFLKQFSAW